ncbi:MAG TPA: nucleotidyl transferase AbiEii/AbiGii toxin family protein [Woeseiaceae bacterium]|nr:nucleotidyl transferase AbiEii/AbiGii toxin family protein [Woeseiaceae bacterium]
MTALNASNVRYLVAGGLAVNAHGYLRFTKDVDLVISLEQSNIGRAMEALTGIGYRPAVPVSAGEFADPEIRQRWIAEKGLTVFQMWSDGHPETPVDIFVQEPFPFDDEYGKALVKPLYDRFEVRFVSIPTLIRMKKAAGRPQDAIDIQYLQARQADDESD